MLVSTDCLFVQAVLLRTGGVFHTLFHSRAQYHLDITMWSHWPVYAMLSFSPPWLALFLYKTISWKIFRKNRTPVFPSPNFNSSVYVDSSILSKLHKWEMSLSLTF